MNVEQQFVDLIKEGKISDAMQSIKDRLTEMAGEAVVEQKYEIAEGYGMKKKEKMSEEDDDKDMDDDSGEEEESEDDDSEDDDKK